MSLEGVYDSNNIFAKIARGEAPSAKVFEDDDTIAFMDVFPQGRGHTLVIHKRARARNLLDADLTDVAPIMATTQRVGRAIIKALNPDGLTVMQFNGEAAGQTIFHLHVHLIPRSRGTPLARHAQGAASSEQLASLARDIAAAIEPKA